MKIFQFFISFTFAFLTQTLFASENSIQKDSIEFSNVIKIQADDNLETIKAKAAHVIPNHRQVLGLDNEFIAFIHFGPNTFSGREWGTGLEDPALFNPSDIDAQQWVRVLKDAGVKMIILTVKHHDGYVLWQSRYTDHGIMRSPYMNGQGDVLKDLSEACKLYDMKLGIYLSPADLYQIEAPEGYYGNGSEKSLRTIPREIENRPFSNDKKFEFVVDDYNEYFLNQLFEVLTEYGPVYEVWFDGANPKEKGGQTYDYDAWLHLVNTLAPEAVVFGAGDVRWCGNEAGYTRESEWNVVPFQWDPSQNPNPGNAKIEDIGSIDRLKDASYLKYLYAETDTSIRDGWFYRDDDAQAVRSADDVYDIYERAVGGNSVLLLNVPPNKEGRFSQRDVDALEETGKRIRETYGINLLQNSSAHPSLLDNNKTTGISFDEDIVITLPEPILFNRLVLQEAVPLFGERVEKVVAEVWQNGEWTPVAQSTNIGNKRILRFPDVLSDKIRIRCLESRLTPVLSTVSAHYYKAHAPQLVISRDKDCFVTIEPKRSDFKWKNALNEASKNLSQGVVIYYTLDGSDPDFESTVYNEPFLLNNKGTVKAMAVLAEEIGPVAAANLGYDKNGWKIVNIEEEKQSESRNIFDSDNKTYSNFDKNNPIIISIGEPIRIKAFSYTPIENPKNAGLIEKGNIDISNNGTVWSSLGEFEFGNLENDPTTRTFNFQSPVEASFLRINIDSVTGNYPKAAIAEIDLF